MKYISVTFLAFLAAILTSCGGSSTAKNISGSWNASILNANGSSAYTFTTNLAQSGGTDVTVSSFGFTSPAPCFTALMGQAATFSVTGSSHGFQTGPFTMTVETALGTQVENILTLTGNRNSGGGISGTWSGTGFSGCTGSGTFSMSAMLPM